MERSGPSPFPPGKVQAILGRPVFLYMPAVHQFEAVLGWREAEPLWFMDRAAGGREGLVPGRVVSDRSYAPQDELRG